MILSHRQKFIFFKTNKTAGTSLEIALSGFCGPRDIITPVAAPDEALRRQLGYPGPQNYYLPLKFYTRSDWMRLLRRGRLFKFYNHIAACKVKPRVDPRIWDHYFKFCFTRNPWDRFVSFYYWRTRKDSPISRADFLDSPTMKLLIKRSYDLYTQDGQLLVDKVYRFENLDQALRDIRKRCGLPAELKLPRTKASYRKARQPYQELLSAAERDKIARLFASEIKRFGYRF